MLNFISLEGFDNDVSKGNLFVSRSQVNRVRQDAEEVGELIDELLFATNRNDPENIEMSEFMEELDIFLNSSNKNDADKTYVPVVKECLSSLESRHKRYMKANSIEEADSLPFLYWIPKMHKKPFSKQ